MIVRLPLEFLIAEREIEQIRKVDKQFETAKATLKASATEISLFIRDSYADGITVDGQPLLSERSLIEAVERDCHLDPRNRRNFR